MFPRSKILALPVTLFFVAFMFFSFGMSQAHAQVGWFTYHDRHGSLTLPIPLNQPRVDREVVIVEQVPVNPAPVYEREIIVTETVWERQERIRREIERRDRERVRRAMEREEYYRYYNH